jgi:hypothetical protein
MTFKAGSQVRNSFFGVGTVTESNSTSTRVCFSGGIIREFANAALTPIASTPAVEEPPKTDPYVLAACYEIILDFCGTMPSRVFSFDKIYNELSLNLGSLTPAKDVLAKNLGTIGGSVHISNILALARKSSKQGIHPSDALEKVRSEIQAPTNPVPNESPVAVAVTESSIQTPAAPAEEKMPLPNSDSAIKSLAKHASNSSPALAAFIDYISHEPFRCSIDYLVPLFLINYSTKIVKEKIDTTSVKIPLDDIASFCLSCLLSQTAGQHLVNDLSMEREQNLQLIQSKNASQNPALASSSDNEKGREFIKKNYVRPQFVRFYTQQSNNCYLGDAADNAFFNYYFLSTLASLSANFYRVILHRMFEFLTKINADRQPVNFFIESLAKQLNYTLLDEDAASFSSSPAADENDAAASHLQKMRNLASEGLYSKDDFMAMMKESGYNTDTDTVEMILRYLAFSPISKRYYLYKKYANIEDYYFVSIAEYCENNDVYRKHNKYHLNEYDEALNHLCNELYLLDQGEGVYTTKKSMSENGVSDGSIRRLGIKIRGSGAAFRFFSLQTIMNGFSDDPIVCYCGNETQLFAIIRHIPAIRWIVMEDGKPLFSFLDTWQLNGPFLLNMLTGQDSMDIYELRDRVSELYGVNYSFRMMEKAAASIGYYYSAEMEKVYRNKDVYIQEVYGNGY